MAQRGETVMMPTLPNKQERLDAVSGLVESQTEPSPENLLTASKRKKHPLHAFFWETPESTWAHIGRYEGARRILRATKIDLVIGGKTIEVRAVEYTRDTEGGGRWASVQDILKTPDLLSGYMMEIEQLNLSAAGKMSKLRELMSVK